VPKRRAKFDEKNEAARLLGSLGGKARARNLSPARRREIARKAIEARWRRRRGDS
jgi:hypothetical protein